ncbi:MAG: NAD-dependent epimerase/dehydratase family protein [Burkholderiales bacterium]|nr:NAD-dependent epimerase/dehydratase family protein [Burkholderiales bacterium]
MSKIALVGAAGAIGRSIASSLSAQGRAYRVIGRSRSALAESFGHDPRAEIVTWNPDDPASVRAALRGIDTMIYLVGVNYWQFDLHPKLMRQTLDGAIAEGVERCLLIGTVYPYGLPRTPRVAEDHPREPHTYKGRMRLAQENLLMAADAAGQIKGTVLRLPDFYGPGIDKSFLGEAFKAGAKGGTADLIGPIDTPHEFVYVPDVGPVVSRLIDQPGAYGRIWHLAGAGVTSQQKLVDEISRQTGRPLKTRVAGPWLVKLMGLFNPMMREMVEMHYLQTHPVLLDDSALTQLLGPIQKTSYSEGVRASLAAHRQTSMQPNALAASR